MRHYLSNIEIAQVSAHVHCLVNFWKFWQVLIEFQVIPEWFGHCFHHISPFAFSCLIKLSGSCHVIWDSNFEWPSKSITGKTPDKSRLVHSKTRSWCTCDHPTQFRLLLSVTFVTFVTPSQDCLFDMFYSPLKELYISLWSSNNWISIIEKFQNSNFYQFRID